MIEVRVEAGDDPQLSDYTGLRDPARRSRLEADGGFFVAEGLFVIERLLGSGLTVRSVLVTPSRLERLRAALGERPITVFVAERDVMEQVVGFDIHRGALASADRPAPVDLTAAIGGVRLVAALEGLNDHENIGSIFRSAAALGVGAVLLDGTCADPWYRRSVRVSMGTVLDLPICRQPVLAPALAGLKAAGFRLVGLGLGPESVPLVSVEPGPATVVVLGAEGPGLSARSLASVDVVAKIPMARSVDSLNVGHAAAIAFHHFNSAG
ncbi:MAG: TrmH family RNA methyltransferase [Acidimicrobiia bacterium]